MQEQGHSDIRLVFHKSHLGNGRPLRYSQLWGERMTCTGVPACSGECSRVLSLGGGLW